MINFVTSGCEELSRRTEELRRPVRPDLQIQELAADSKLYNHEQL